MASSPVRAQTRDTLAVFENSQGMDLRASVTSLNRHAASIEVYSPFPILRLSEALSNFRILVGERIIYAGRAIITGLVNASSTTICEVTLSDSWQDVGANGPGNGESALQRDFSDFTKLSQESFRVRADFKLVVADMLIFLQELRCWLDQVELGILSKPSGSRQEYEREIIEELQGPILPMLALLFEKFEAAAESAESDPHEHRAAHRAYAKRLLHPLLLCSPFLYRTFTKPLGYAGDYEMVNMICRDPLEGSTLFAKIVNLWFLRQPPAEAHRNRISFLADRIIEVCARAAREGRKPRILSLGCGPAFEVQRFIAQSTLADQAEFTLIDFNEETIAHVTSVLQNLKRAHNRGTRIEIVRKSVNQILKEAGRGAERTSQNGFDFAYCAGLFDYLPDLVCRRISSLLYDWVTPGGLYLSTNVDLFNPRRLTMEYVMDWCLIYRKGAQLAALGPDRAVGAESSITADLTGVNVHFAVTKPNHG